jgi:hypothetical protein
MKKTDFPPERHIASFGLNPDPKEFKAYQVREQEALDLLCHSYDIAPGPAMYYTLALKLARELFVEQKKRGSKTKWDLSRRVRLVLAVESLIGSKRGTRGVEWACIQLSNKDEWSSFLSKSGKSSVDPAQSLRQNYYKSLKDGETMNRVTLVKAVNKNLTE